jgi:hypothetical protein
MKIKTLRTVILNKRWTACTAAMLCLLVSSCIKNEREDPPKTKRVVLMYMGGDNNLSAETYEKIEAIRSGWQATPQNRLLIYTDSADDLPKVYELSKESGQRLMFTYEEENSADKDVLSRIINDVQVLYNPESYGLIVFSNASGWLPKHTAAHPQSVITDNDNEMELYDFATAIPDSTFDFIIFEACFMAGIEVAYQLKDKTEYIVASSTEIISPGFTPVYGEAISCLFEPAPSLPGFVNKVFSSQAGYKNSATFSIIKTSELEQLAIWIKNNVFWNRIADISNTQHFDRYSEHLFYDFYDYYKQLLPRDDQRQQLAELVAKCVIYKITTPTFMLRENGFEIKEYSGLTTYIYQKQLPYLKKNSRPEFAVRKELFLNGEGTFYTPKCMCQ